MDNMLQLYHNSMKGHIEEKHYIFNITKSQIHIDNGKTSDLYEWQKNMLEEIINFAYHNQSKVIYQNTSLSYNHTENGFWYNILALENGEVYLINLSTNNFRKIDFEFKEKNIN
jgi:hypothetical protein